MTTTSSMTYVPEAPTGQETLEAIRDCEQYVAEMRASLLQLQATVGISKELINAYNWAREQAYQLGAALKRDLIAAGVPPMEVPPATKARPLEDGPLPESRATSLGLARELPGGQIGWHRSSERVTSLGWAPVVVVAAFAAGGGIAFMIYDLITEGRGIAALESFQDWSLALVRGAVGVAAIQSRNEMREMKMRTDTIAACLADDTCTLDDIHDILGRFSRRAGPSEWPSTLKWAIGLSALALVVGAAAFIYVEASSGGAVGKSLRKAS